MRAPNDSPPSPRKSAMARYSTLRNPLAAFLMDRVSEFVPQGNVGELAAKVAGEPSPFPDCLFWSKILTAVPICLKH